jgi:hypothetical protein
MNLSPWSRLSIPISCTIDIAQTGRSFHAHAIPIGIDLRPGDVVQLHDAPASAAFGESVSGTCRATVLRANAITRFWTRATSLFSLTDLYEVGFDAREAL